MKVVRGPSPPAGAKMRREHKTPLSRQAIEILANLKSITGHRRLTFPGLRTVERPISENTFNAALRRMGYAQDEATSHGFRATFSTLANESGKWSVDAIERHLAHQDADAVRRAYARGAFWDERTALCQWWSDQCDTLRLGGRSGAIQNVRGLDMNAKANAKPATLAEMAAVEFEPWNPANGYAVPPMGEWRERAEDHLVTVRIAENILYKTKSELKGVLASIDNETGDQLFQSFVSAIEFFTAHKSILEAAEARILAAGAALELEE